MISRKYLSKVFLSQASQNLRQFSSIQSIIGRQILDSRGNPTVEAEVQTKDGWFRAAVPSGASTGIYEAVELRDKDPKRFFGKGVQKAVENINKTLNSSLKGKDVTNQKQIDEYMVKSLDGTKNQWGFPKAKLGANAILAVSMAVARAGAKAKNVPLYTHLAALGNCQGDRYVMPVPSFNIINGGEHAGNKIAMQEFMILPTGATSFKQAVRMGSQIYHSLGKNLKKRFGISAGNVGDEGGFCAPQINSEEQALDLITQSIEMVGYTGKVKIGLDPAASQFYRKEEGGKQYYDLGYKSGDQNKKLSYKELENVYASFTKKYPVVSIEDPFDQDHFEAYKSMQKNLGSGEKGIQIVGDDLLVTNPIKVKKAIEEKWCNALLLKVNQIGTVSESIQSASLSKQAKFGVMVSHRSGQTEDTFIADLVVGINAGQIKSGAPCRSDRLAKYNQLIRIEEELGEKSIYAGEHFNDPSRLL